MAITPTDGSVILTENDRAVIVDFLAATGGDGGEVINAPEELKHLLNAVFQAIKDQRPLSISMLPEEITTTTAAAMLDVSRPTVMKYIRGGRLTARMVGSHHRLQAQEVLELLEEFKQQQRELVFELMAVEETLAANQH